MDLITLDFETYYDKQYSLSKMTTEEYIRDPQFEAIGVSVKVNDGETQWASGSHKQLRQYLQSFNWKDAMLLAHNTMFDGAILNWHFGCVPRVYTDTLCIARALHGVEVGGSLKALAERYAVGVKGNEVVNALGKRRKDFTPEELDAYGDYCVNDTDICYDLFNIMGTGFPKQELKTIDATLRMFVTPLLELNPLALDDHLVIVKAKKKELLDSIPYSKKELMSNPKFAELLEGLGVVPPTKISLKTEKEAFAFAKTDEAFTALLNHEDVRVQALVSARLGTKSTLEETRTERFIGIASRGSFPAPIKYYAAHTGRWGGDDKINVQNLPSRGASGNKLKDSIMAPQGYTLLDTDSSQIEARVLAWWAGQMDLVTAFQNKEDVYVQMAVRIYGFLQDQIDKAQRFVGKSTILGAGYGMGALRFQEQLRNFGVQIDLDECRRIINIYRDTNPAITQLWKDAGYMLENLCRGESSPFGKAGVVTAVAEESAILLPSGLLMRYADLEGEQGERGIEYTYKARYGRTRIYGGKVVENICQALARIIIRDQMLLIQKRFPALMMVHDSVITMARTEDIEEAYEYVEECMHFVPDWAEGLPITCETNVGKTYGGCTTPLWLKETA